MGKWQMVYIPSKKEIIKLQAERILKKLSQILEKTDVWCCNDKATKRFNKCEHVLCKYKADKQDRVRGCSLCQLFQLTTKARSWKNAQILYDFGDVTQDQCNITRRNLL